MFDYLQQFNSLPQGLREKVSSPEAMAKLSNIEKKYGLDLAMVVMRVMIKTLSLKDMTTFFVSEFGLSLNQAQNLTQDLKTEIFSAVADYVGMGAEAKTLDLYRDIDAFIKEAGLAISSEFLIERLKKILATYLKGVRSKIDAREALAKDVNTGGLGLSDPEIDRVLKICDTQHVKYEDTGFKESNSSLQTSKRLEDIIAGSDKSKLATSSKSSASANVPTQEYDLKKALASGETKKISAPAETPAIAPASTSDDVSAGTPVSTPKSASVDAPTKPESTTPVTPTTVTPSPKSTTKDEEEIKKESAALKDAIVHKPESSSLFKKLFAESQKQASAGSIKFAAKADETKKTTAAPTTLPSSGLKKETAPPKSQSQSQPQSQPLTPEKTSTVASRPADSRVDKPKMQDVRVVPKIMGPIEELQFLDLVNFRRLGKTPEEITTKIFNKIKMLERDGYERMITGITAWKKSPVSLLYLKIVQEAIVAGVTLQQAVSARQSQNQDHLDIDEINAIIKLNSRLVF